MDQENVILKNVEDNRWEGHFSSPMKLWTKTKASPANEGYWGKLWRGIEDKSWTGASSLDEVEEVMRKGWGEGAKKIRDAFGRLAVPTATCIKRKQVWGDEGEEVDMDRVRNGNLEIAWRKTPRRTFHGPSIIRVWVPLTMSAYHSTDDYFWRGAVSATVVDALEDAGYRCEVVGYEAGSGAYNNGLAGFFTVRMKEPDDPMSLPLMAMSAYAPMLRVAFFRAIVSGGDKADCGLGRPDHNKPKEALENDVVVESNIHSEKEAKDYVQTWIKTWNEAHS